MFSRARVGYVLQKIEWEDWLLHDLSIDVKPVALIKNSWLNVNLICSSCLFFLSNRAGWRTLKMFFWLNCQRKTLNRIKIWFDYHARINVIVLLARNGKRLVILFFAIVVIMSLIVMVVFINFKTYNLLFQFLISKRFVNNCVIYR